MTQSELASRSGVSLKRVTNFETGERQPIRAVMEAIRNALDDAGVEFIRKNGGGSGGSFRQPAQELKEADQAFGRSARRVARLSQFAGRLHPGIGESRLHFQGAVAEDRRQLGLLESEVERTLARIDQLFLSATPTERWPLCALLRSYHRVGVATRE